MAETQRNLKGDTWRRRRDRPSERANPQSFGHERRFTRMNDGGERKRERNVWTKSREGDLKGEGGWRETKTLIKLQTS